MPVDKLRQKPRLKAAPRTVGHSESLNAANQAPPQPCLTAVANAQTLMSDPARAFGAKSQYKIKSALRTGGRICVGLPAFGVAFFIAWINRKQYRMKKQRRSKETGDRSSSSQGRSGYVEPQSAPPPTQTATHSRPAASTTARSGFSTIARTIYTSSSGIPTNLLLIGGSTIA